jgi:hypothetical protein
VPIRLAIVSVVVTAAAVGLGMAASLNLAAGSLGSRSIATPRCTSTGLLVTQNLSGTTVVSVTVAGIPAGCAGAVVQATVNNGAVSGSGSATVGAGGGSVSVTLATAPAVTAAELTDVVLIGP